MSVEETISATEPAAVQVETHGGLTDVWLRQDVEQDTADNGTEESYTFWRATELHFTVQGTPTVEEIEADFDSLWAEHEQDDLTDAEKIAALQEELTDLQVALVEVYETMGD